MPATSSAIALVVVFVWPCTSAQSISPCRPCEGNTALLTITKEGKTCKTWLGELDGAPLTGEKCTEMTTRFRTECPCIQATSSVPEKLVSCNPCGEFGDALHSNNLDNPERPCIPWLKEIKGNPLRESECAAVTASFKKGCGCVVINPTPSPPATATPSPPLTATPTPAPPLPTVSGHTLGGGQPGGGGHTVVTPGGGQPGGETLTAAGQTPPNTAEGCKMEFPDFCSSADCEGKQCSAALADIIPSGSSNPDATPTKSVCVVVVHKCPECEKCANSRLFLDDVKPRVAGATTSDLGAAPTIAAFLGAAIAVALAAAAIARRRSSSPAPNEAAPICGEESADMVAAQ